MIFLTRAIPSLQICSLAGSSLLITVSHTKLQRSSSTEQSLCMKNLSASQLFTCCSYTMHYTSCTCSITRLHHGINCWAVMYHSYTIKATQILSCILQVQHEATNSLTQQHVLFSSVNSYAHIHGWMNTYTHTHAHTTLTLMAER